MKTKAQQLGITEFPYREFDKNGNKIYYEDSEGYWEKREYDSNNNQISFKTSDGYWSKYEYDSNNNRIHYEDSYGYWSKYEYDSNNNEIYYENSDGYTVDNRPQPQITPTPFLQTFLTEQWTLQGEIYENEFNVPTLSVGYPGVSHSDCIEIYSSINRDDEDLHNRANLIASSPILAQLLIKVLGDTTQLNPELRGEIKSKLLELKLIEE